MTAPRDVRLLVLDVDGVMTDGSIVLDPLGNEHKRFHVRDGTGIAAWQRLGRLVAIITGRQSPAVDHRARELRIPFVAQGSTDKGADLRRACLHLGVPPDQAACLADDWPDLPLMRAVAYPMAVADAHPDVRALARFVTTLPGGSGAVREAIEHLLAASDDLPRARSLYDASS